MTFNDKTVIPEATINGLLDELMNAFHGWTIEGIVKGAYRMRTGETHVEELMKISVILDTSQLAAFEVMVQRWCALLDQEVMLLKIAEYRVEFVPPRQRSDE